MTILANRYDIQRHLGRQPGRQTLLAKDLETDQHVVVKLLLLGDDFEWQNLKLFQREAATLKTLSHPAIPRYLDYLEVETVDGKGFALVQSYVNARSLEEHLRAGRSFSETEVQAIARSLLDILIYLHQQTPPIIHRDIKPSNILLTNRSGNSPGQVYLVDFGSVQNVIAQEGSTITVVGTYGYMPPEQFGGRVSPASDLYSLGATLIFLTTGRHPTELPQQDFHIQFRDVAGVSDTFADWLEWLTEPGLDQRYSTAEVALRSLDAPQPRQKSPRRSTFLPTIPQPAGSDVVLKVTPTSLEVLTPRAPLGYGKLAVITFIIPIAWWLFGSGCFLNPSIFLNLAALIPSVAIAIGILVSFLNQVWLRIDDDTISQGNYLLGWRWPGARSIPREATTRLTISRYFARAHVRKIWRLVIYVNGEQTFVLNNRSLTSEELAWLAQVLSEWLGLPVDEE